MLTVVLAKARCGGPAHTVAGDIGKRNAESCAAYNMLKVARYLFFIEQKPAYMDYYERTILNHILGGKSRDLDSGTALTPGNCYMYPVNPATQKEYGDGNIGILLLAAPLWKATRVPGFPSTSTRRINKELYVNLFTASTLDWTDTGLKLAQETNYPEEETSTISITAAPKSAVTFRIRIPAWSKGAKIEVNGKAIDGVTAGEYATVAGSWKVGDKIVVTIPLRCAPSRLMTARTSRRCSTVPRCSTRSTHPPSSSNAASTSATAWMAPSNWAYRRRKARRTTSS